MTREYEIKEDLVRWDFMARNTMFNEVTGCILWCGSTDADGYGFLTIDGTRYLAHRVAYTLAIGCIPEGLVLDHLCAHPRCVNPDHLEAVTVRVNNQRAPRVSRGAYGPRDPGRGYSERHARRLNKPRLDGS